MMRAASVVLLLPLVLAAACDRDPIEVRRVPKEAPSAAMAMPADGEAAAPAAPASNRPHWTAPKGWTEKAGAGMRAASFVLPTGSGKAEVSVVTFPGDAGGELANVNRWRGQIALPPIEQSAVAAARTSVRAAIGEVRVYDFTATGDKPARVVAGMLSHGGATWFFKLNGDAKAVEAAKPAFLELLRSLKP